MEEKQKPSCGTVQPVVLGVRWSEQVTSRLNSTGPEASPSPAYDYGGGVTAYIDFPREIVNDKHCYQISAVATGSIEGARTAEICLSGL